MAVYNEILSGRFNRALQKVFGIKGPPPVPQLAGEIQPSLPLFFGAEGRYLEGWNRFAVNIAPAAGGAGTRSAVRLRNPVGSGILVVVEKIAFILALADSPFMTIGAAVDLTPGIVANTAFDNRGSATPVAILSSSVNVGAVLGANAWQGIGPANSMVEVITDGIHEFPLLPQTTASTGNGAITLYSNTLNQGLNVAVWWRERVLEDSEKT
jgi:hypothetical protein